ncbi:MAG: TonB-dependent receptor [Proteobacteria bacterium]|nr:TonB-dependent receptor [Pseudomonadota bacterium]
MKISAAVAAILGASAAALAAAADQAASTATTGGGLEEVVVTAQRRVENLQDVPLTVQAISGDQLQKLSVVSFNDLMKYTPNVSYSGNGPGTGNIFMRGLGLSGSGNQSQSTTQPFPNVALYLDDQSMTFPARNNDVYLADMERVEILEGPQGTLFGGGAQAGAVRYITNKPKFNGTSGEFNAAYGVTAGGDPNTALNGVLNLPLSDSFALRGVIFSERRGGYIDNVASTIRFFPGTLPPGGGNPTSDNYTLTGRATNPVDYQGARLSAAWKINSDWNLLVQQNYQDMHADGYFYAYPIGTDGATLNRYQITAFSPAFSKDRYNSTAWTLDGKLGDLLSLVYTGSYMVRHIEGQQDYSNYVRSAVGSYYACIGTGAGYFNSANFPAQLTGKPLQCYSPVGNWHDTTRNTHHSEELRVSTSQDYRVRGLAGVYWEKFTIYDMMDFNYLRMPQCDAATLAAEQAGGPDCLSAVGPVPGAFASNPALRTNSNTAFGEDVMRGYRQTAFFTSVDVDLIPKVLTATGGVRFYKYNEFEHGSEYYSESTGTPVVDHLNGVCTAGGACGFPINLEKSESGHRFRGNLTWHIAPDMMAYYTYSEGFRPGGFNRTNSTTDGQIHLSAVAPYCGAASTDPACLVGGALYGKNTKQFLKPAGYHSDNLKNNEIGLKTQWFDHRLLVNLSGYIMKWTDIQLPLFDPVHLGNTTFDINGPSYKVKGFEVQVVARITDGLTIEGSSSVNAAEQTNAPCLPSNRVSPYNPTPIGQCITTVKGKPYTNPYGVLGTRPPFSPPWMFNLRARYDWSVGTYKPFAWVGASHVSGQSNQPASFPDGNDPAQANPTTTLLRYEIPGYTTYDGAIGVSKDAWTAQISGSNISNVYGPSNISSGQFIKSEIPLRPRVIMFQFGYKF